MNEPLLYEDFGARGDGIADDLPAIVATHEEANRTGRSVQGRADATYHLGRKALTALIGTDTDWGTSRFTIDDTDVEDHKRPLFRVVSLLQPTEVSLERLERDQEHVGFAPGRECLLRVESDERRVFIRRGLNQNEGVPPHDMVLVAPDGAILCPIDWDHPRISKVEVFPVDESVLTVRGGVFTTIANRMRQDIGYNYWNRGIEIERSRTEMVGVVHYIMGETDYGHPYRGFLSAHNCAYVTYRDCFFTGHKIYQTIGAAGLPVSMGSYDAHANSVVHFRMVGCRMNQIHDRTRWGAVASNFCKFIELEDCELSRMDTHMGVSGHYIIRRCKLGYQGLRAIGRGLLLMTDTHVTAQNFVIFRSDYGSTWHGKLEIQNSRWTPTQGPWSCSLIAANNDGMHDFGYPCSLPHEIHIDGLQIDDQGFPKDQGGLLLVPDPDGDSPDLPPPDQRPFPYAHTQSIHAQHIQTQSGLPLRLPNGLS